MLCFCVLSAALQKPVKERDFASEVVLNSPQSPSLLKGAATFPPITSEVASSCVREYFDLQIAGLHDDCETLAEAFFSRLNTGLSFVFLTSSSSSICEKQVNKSNIMPSAAKSSEKLFWVCLDLLRYCGKNPKSGLSTSFARHSLILKSVFPKWTTIISILG